MVEALTSGRLLIAIVAVWALLPSLAAHRLDEYLQATVAMIEPDSIRLRMRLTPGVDVADQVLAKIDLNRDAIISEKEAATYAEALRRDLVVRLDQSDAGLEVAALSFAETDELRTGRGTIRIEFSVTATPLAVGAHTLAVENRHLPKASAYLFNAALPKSASVKIGRQKRSNDQHRGQIEFEVFPQRASSLGTRREVGVGPTASVRSLWAPCSRRPVGDARARRRRAATWPSNCQDSRFDAKFPQVAVCQESAAPLRSRALEARARRAVNSYGSFDRISRARTLRPVLRRSSH